MKFPDAVTILRQTTADEYGNPRGSWEDYATAQTVGFKLQRPDGSHLLLMPPRTNVRPTDRVRVQGGLYEVKGDPVFVRSPSKDVMTQVGLLLISAAYDGGDGGFEIPAPPSPTPAV